MFIKKGYINLRGYLKNFKILILNFSEKSHKAFWFEDANNFGDVITPKLLKWLGAESVVKIDTAYYPFENYLTIGSILSLSNKKSIVWGSGFISANNVFKHGSPKKILAVRGPLTRNRVLELGVDCPEVYGDPALLLPRFYKSKGIKKRYKLGIIPHYNDKNNKWLQDKFLDNVLIIDVQNKNIFEFIDQINSCEKIASSSLHGIIVADAYGIPSLWLEFSELMGKNFKFIDYFQSVGRLDKMPIKMDETISIEFILSRFYSYKINIDLDKLFESCPIK
ncbi:polysaccharide pyruvyl transferase family protein [Lutibacter citreus]|uniref:polysaccharide pyruvyl transferase family protein n=1 Tax=Lutibacter citreus TaxID=2138210 RepID=UPI000DBE44A1|nr:polysaccharide pyruvyl transferase family protein [Lutibacter citreus]